MRIALYMAGSQGIAGDSVMKAYSVANSSISNWHIIPPRIMRSAVVVLGAVTFLLFTLSVFAAGEDTIQPGVGRISFIHGDVSTQRGDDSGWGSTSINAPMVPGDQIQTGDS